MRTPENARPLYPACRILLILLACGLTGCASLLPPKGKARVEPRPYNVLWLTSESMNVKHLGCYGYPLEKETSPHLDNFAKTAVRFETCMTASAWTSENMVSYFTGINSLVHKVHARNHHTPPEWYTPMEILRDYGYAIPRLSGYQADVNYNHLGFEANVTPMFPTDWLEANKDKRFFIWHHFLSPHLPYAPKHIARKKFWKDEYVPNAESRKRIDFVEKQGVVVKGSVEFIPEEDTIPMHALYDGGVHRMDYEFLVVMRKLEELGLRENTIVIFSADHGEELLEHGFVGHASTSKHAQLYDEILHIPLMISLPGRIPQNLVISQQVRAIDIMPTIFDLLELPIPEYMEGRSLLPLMEKPETAQPRDAFFSTSMAGYKEDDPENVRGFKRALRTPEFKLIKNITDLTEFSWELYDLKNDPEEKINLVDQRPEKVAELQARLEAWEQTSRTWEDTYFSQRAYVEPVYRKSIWQKFRALFPRRPINLEGVDSPPLITSPEEGAVLTAENTEGVITVDWTGKDHVPYVFELDCGENEYRFSTFVRLKGPQLVRKFSPSYWNEFIVQYNPARVRVKIDLPNHEWSPWRTVEFK